jgi:hypothetical protein
MSSPKMYPDRRCRRWSRTTSWLTSAHRPFRIPHRRSLNSSMKKSMSRPVRPGWSSLTEPALNHPLRSRRRFRWSLSRKRLRKRPGFPSSSSSRFGQSNFPIRPGFQRLLSCPSERSSSLIRPGFQRLLSCPSERSSSPTRPATRSTILCRFVHSHRPIPRGFPWETSCRSAHSSC